MHLTAIGWTTVVYLAALLLGCFISLEAFPKVGGGNVAAGGAAVALLLLYAAAATAGWLIAVAVAAVRTHQLEAFRWGTCFFGVLVVASLFQLIHLAGFNRGAAVGIGITSAALLVAALLSRPERATVIAASIAFALGLAFALSALALQTHRRGASEKDDRLGSAVADLDLPVLKARFQASHFDPAARHDLGYRLAAMAWRLDVLAWFVSQQPEASGGCSGLIAAATSGSAARLDEAWKGYQGWVLALKGDDAKGLSNCEQAAIALGLSQENPAQKARLRALSSDVKETDIHGLYGLSFLADAQALHRFIRNQGLRVRNGKLDPHYLWASSGLLTSGGALQRGPEWTRWKGAARSRRLSLFAVDELLIKAASDRDHPEVKRMLESGAAAEFTGLCGNTPLTAAIQGGDWGIQDDHLTYLSITELLIRHGANPNTKGAFWACLDSSDARETETPLHYAVMGISFDRQKQLTTIETLLKAGADPNRKSSRGETPLKVAQTIFFDDSVSNAIATLLKNHGAK